MSSVFLVIAAAFLWLFPLWIFRGKDARLGNFDQRAWPQGRNLVLTVIDVVRAAVGARLMVDGVAGLPVPRGLPDAWMPAVWLATALGVALTVQALSWRDEDHVRAPVAFLFGATLVLIDLWVLLIGLPLAVGAALAVRAWSAAFLGAGVALAGVGLMVAQDWRRAVLLGVVVNAPVVVAVMAGRHMGAPRK